MKPEGLCGGRSADKKVDPAKRMPRNATPATRSAEPLPSGTRKNLPVYVERSILTLPAIYINGGLRGFSFKFRQAF